MQNSRIWSCKYHWRVGLSPGGCRRNSSPMSLGGRLVTSRSKLNFFSGSAIPRLAYTTPGSSWLNLFMRKYNMKRLCKYGYVHYAKHVKKQIHIISIIIFLLHTLTGPQYLQYTRNIISNASSAGTYSLTLYLFLTCTKIFDCTSNCESYRCYLNDCDLELLKKKKKEKIPEVVQGFNSLQRAKVRSQECLEIIGWHFTSLIFPAHNLCSVCHTASLDYLSNISKWIHLCQEESLLEQSKTAIWGELRVARNHEVKISCAVQTMNRSPDKIPQEVTILILPCTVVTVKLQVLFLQPISDEEMV